VPVSAAVARQAAEVRARLGGRSERAVQIATALDARADLYLTRDSGLRRIAGMEVLDLTDFVEV
jgi:predicted nucleic acid-binding protein